MLQMGRYHDALASSESALKHSPDVPDLLINRSVALRELKRLDESLETLDRILQIDPNHPDALNSRATVLRELSVLTKRGVVRSSPCCTAKLWGGA